MYPLHLHILGNKLELKVQQLSILLAELLKNAFFICFMSSFTSVQNNEIG